MGKRNLQQKEQEAYEALRRAHKLLLELQLVHMADSLIYPLVSLEKRLDL